MTMRMSGSTDAATTDQSYWGARGGARSRIVADLRLRGRSALDVATGNGHFALEMAAANPSLEVLGIDISEPFLVFAAQLAEELGLSDRCAFAKADLRSLDTSSERFDVVTCYAGLGDLLRQRYLGSVIGQLGRAVSPRGQLVLCEAFEDDALAERERLGFHVLRCLGYQTPTKEELRQALRQAGMRILREQTYRTGPVTLSGDALLEFVKSECGYNAADGSASSDWTEVWRRVQARTGSCAIAELGHSMTAFTCQPCSIPVE